MKTLANEILIVDGMNAAHRFRHAYRELATEAGVPSGALFGFVQMIHSLRKDFPGRAIIIAWESGSCWRYKLYPQYKSARKDNVQNYTDEEKALWVAFKSEQLQAIEWWLNHMGVLSISLPEYEGDDVIGFMATQFKSLDVVIVSTDSDMCQLASNERVRIYNPITQCMCYQDTRGALMKHTDFVAHTPEMALWHKAVIGDKSDSVPGVYGVGEKTLAGFFTSVPMKDETFLNYLERHRSVLENSKRGRDILASRQIILRNLMLMDLRGMYRELGIRKCGAQVPCGLSSWHKHSPWEYLREVVKEYEPGQGITDGWKRDPCKALAFLRKWDFQAGVNHQFWKSMWHEYADNHELTKQIVWRMIKGKKIK